jgi:SAM-dependent methyltransferase
VFDILHEPGTRAEGRGLIRIARRFGAWPERGVPIFLEPACGSGRYLRALAGLGCRAVGFDVSPAMVAYARRTLRAAGLWALCAAGRRRGATAFRADMTHFRVVYRADVVFSTINTIRHLPSDRAMLAHLARIRAALNPRGVCIIGLSLSLRGESPGEDVWTARRAGVRVTQVVQYLPPRRGRREWVHSHVVVRRRGVETHHDSRYWLRCYTRTRWNRLLARARFRTLGIVNEQGHDADPGRLGYALWVLRPLTRSRSSG